MKPRNQMFDPVHLRSSQYVDDAPLRKRIAIHERFSTNPQPWTQWLFEQIDFPPSPRVLELGCGKGMIWHENQHRLPAAMSLTLTDLSPGMLDSARTTLQGSEVEFDTRVVDAQSLPFPDATFDIVIANHMLYHIPDIPRTISGIRRVLVPGGQLVAATNGETHMSEMNDLIATVQGRQPDRSVATRFSLEHGADLLDQVFSFVERREFPNDLDVTEVQPVIDYIDSTSVEDTLRAPEIERARLIVAKAIEQHRSFRIRKSAGVFIAR